MRFIKPVATALALGATLLAVVYLSGTGSYLTDSRSSNNTVREMSPEEFARVLSKARERHLDRMNGADTTGRNGAAGYKPVSDTESNRNLSPVRRRWEASFDTATRSLLEQVDVKPVSPGSSSMTIPFGRLSGDTVTLSDYRGQWLLVNFWATWCVPCREELPSLNRLNSEFNPNLKVVGINVGESESDIREFLDEFQVNFRVGVDQRRRLTSAFQVHYLPETWLIGPAGSVLGVAEGPRDWHSKRMVELFKKLTSSKPVESGKDVSNDE